MNEKTKTVYYCDFCRKHGLSKPRMIYHESVCFSNPANKRPCTDCNFLEKKDAVITGEHYDGSEWERKLNLFYCTAKKTFLHTPKNAIKGNVFDLGSEENNPMPVSCDQFESIQTIFKV